MQYSFEDYRIDPDGFLLLKADKPVSVEPQVFDLLHLLVANAGRVITREELFDRIWKGRIVSEAALSSRIKAARKAIGDDGKAQRLIRTVHGRGFVFSGPQAAPADQAAADPSPPVGAGPLSDAVMQRPAIAVLPFEAGEGEAGYRATGITEEIIAVLASWRWFPVIARNASFRYAGSDKPPGEIGRELGARYLVTGSFRTVGSVVKLTAALVDAELNHEIWSRSYRRPAEDIFEAEEEMAREIVAALESQASAAEMGRIRLKRASDLTAWDLAQQASWLIDEGSPQSLEAAERMARRACELDPSWSYPYALVAFARFQLAMRTWTTTDPKVAFVETLEAAREALRIDAGSWIAHALCGVGELWTHGSHEKALAHLEEAIAINPSACWSYHFMGCIAGFAGDLDNARRMQARVFNLDPLYPHTGVVQADLALWSLLSGDLEKAEAHILRSVEWAPDYGRGLHRALAIFGLKNDRAAARKMFSRLTEQGRALDPVYIRESYPFKIPAHRELFFDGLRRAGVNI